MSMKKLAVLFVVAPLVMLVGVHAVNAADPIKAKKGDSNFYNPHDTFNPNVEEYKWAEQDTRLPPFPKDDNLIEFQVTRPNAAFHYFIDPDSISYTEADGVVRYTVVIRSRSGANNVAFEGMRCSTREYKTYAFGNGKGKFVQPRRVEWKRIAENDYTRYRQDLAEFYFCNIHIVNLSAEKIISELKYPRRDLQQSGFH